MTAFLTGLQLAGALALLVGVVLLLPLGAALVVDGALVLVLSTVAEVVATRAQSRAEKTGQVGQFSTDEGSR